VLRFFLDSAGENMPVIAVINRKGGSGKSTLATHIAAFLANHDTPVMLGDIDRQQSSKTWLRLRGDKHKPIMSWAVDHQNVRRLPSGVQYAVIDTPGGLHGFDLAKVVMFADYIVMPVCGSIFDRESASDCLAELRKLPRVVTGKCQIGIVGMRVGRQTGAAEVVEKWANAQQVPIIASLTESTPYVSCIEQGLTLFDLDRASVKHELDEWKPLLIWLAPEVVRQHDFAKSRFPQAAAASENDTLQQATVIPMPNRQVSIPGQQSGMTPRRQPLAPVTHSVLKPTRLGSLQGPQPTAGNKSRWFDSALIPAFLRANR
jgi:chromosome partitioning protein